MHPSPDEGRELVRRGYSIFEQLPDPGKRGLKRALNADNDDNTASAPSKEMKLELQEKAEKSLEETRSAFKQAIEEKGLLEIELREAADEKKKRDSAFAEGEEENNRAIAAFEKLKAEKEAGDVATDKVAAERKKAADALATPYKLRRDIEERTYAREEKNAAVEAR